MTHHALIVDDNTSNLSALEQLLKREGLAVTALESPAQISNALDNTDQIDVLFLDLEFPNYDGMDIVGDLLNDPRLQNVPIVACSVHISELNEARNAGFHSFIGKPLNVGAFSDQLNRILNDERVWEVI